MLAKASDSEAVSIFMLSTVKEAQAAREMLAGQDYQDGISEEEAQTVGLMYWRAHKHEYKFLSGGLGTPEDQGEYWFLPYFWGTNAERSSHGVLINKITGECTHPKLQTDRGYMLLQNAIEQIDLFIAKKLMTTPEQAQK